MSMERQPARLATINLRAELDKMSRQTSTEKPKTFGLLSSSKKEYNSQKDNDSEASRVLRYMKSIRESMTNGI